jgi:two-component system, cell cycle sensor histidine kinase and response regulator CckA
MGPELPASSTIEHSNEPDSSAREPLQQELGRLARLAARLLSADAAIVSLFDPAKGRVSGGAGEPRLLARLEQLVPEILELHGRVEGPLLLPPPAEADSADHLQDFPRLRGCLLSLPVLEGGQPVGCLALMRREARGWAEADAIELEDLAAMAAARLEEATQLEETSWLEETVQVQAAYLDHLFEAAPEAIAVLDSDHRVRRVNAQYTRMFGYLPEEAIGRTPIDLTVPREQVEEAREIGARARGGERVESQVVRRRKDGTLVHVRLNAIPVRVSRGQVGVYVIFRDLTEMRDAEEALERKEKRFRSLTENATDLVAIVTPGGAIDYVTPSVERLLGHSAGSLAGTSAFALLHPDDAPGTISRFSGLLRKDCDDALEARLRTASGGWRTFEIRARNLVEDRGLAGVVINARDVTDELVAKLGHRQLESFLEATPDFVATFDPRGRGIRINKAFRDLLGLGDVNAQDLTIADLFPQPVTERLLHEGIPSATRDGVWSGETYLLSTDGTEVPISQVLLAHRTSAGSVEFISTLGRDITAQKQAEQALRRSEAHFRSLIENALDIIFVADVEGRISFVSPSVGRVLGYTQEEIVGTSMFSVVHPEDLELATRQFSQVREGGEPSEASEVRVRHRDGSYRRLESVGENLLDDGAVAGIVINSRDVTERRQTEEALFESQQQLLQAQKMEAVGRLAGGIAHDFNNLLTAIKGFTELLLLDFDEMDPRRAFATEIQGAATRAAGLTRQLLAFSRRQVLQPEVLDLNATIREIERMLQRMVGEDMSIVCALDDRLGRVKADPGQLEQVLMNLVVNARDAMPNGGEVRISTSNAELTEADAQVYPYVEPGDFVVLEVRDTGHGMSREIQDRVFEPFFTTKEQGKGTGLGLSMVYGIVKQSGGYIWLESEPGEGTTFRIYLPRVHEAVGERQPEMPATGSVAGSETILLVEDEMAVRVLVRRVLERAGYKVLEAASGPDALALLAARNPDLDLLLTDVVMPGMSGRQLADQLTDAMPGLRVLYMSGYTDEAIVHHGVLEPGVAFLEKPFPPDVLLRRLREVLDNSPARAG